MQPEACLPMVCNSSHTACSMLPIRVELTVGVVGDLHHTLGEELPDQLLQPMFSVFHTALHPQNLRAVGGQICDDALVAVVGEREWVEFGGTIPFIEQRLVLYSVPDRADAAAHEHQVPLLGCKDRV